MNPTLQLLNDRRSERNFTDELIRDDVLDAIIHAGQRAPSTMNSQNISAVVVRDAGKRARLAELAGGQPWIAKAPVFVCVVADFYKTGLAVEMAGKQQMINECLEGMMAVSTDAGIVLASMATAANAQGLGCVAIGGVRADVQAVAELLELPDRTFVILGLAIGHVASQLPLKPRLPISTFRHDESYHTAGLSETIKAYDRTLIEYWQHIGRTDGASWSNGISVNYSRNYRPTMKAALAKRGFKIEE